MFELGSELKLTAKEKLNLTVIEYYDEKNDKTIESDLILEKDETITLDLESETEETISGQFGDGSMIYGLKKNMFYIEVSDGNC